MAALLLVGAGSSAAVGAEHKQLPGVWGGAGIRYMTGTDFLPVDLKISLMEASTGTVRPTIAKGHAVLLQLRSAEPQICPQHTWNHCEPCAPRRPCHGPLHCPGRQEAPQSREGLTNGVSR